MDSGPTPVARSGSGAKAAPLAARPTARLVTCLSDTGDGEEEKRGS